jgi:protein-histidine pros-kinase
MELGFSSGVLAAAAALVVAVLAATVAWLARQLASGRRRLQGELRELVAVVEDLREGRARKPAEASGGSPVIPLSDALTRLGHELHGKWSEAEAAADRWRALIDASEAMAVITTDTDGDIRSFSNGATALFGWEQDEVLSRPAAIVFEEQAYKDLLPKLARKNLRRQGVTAHSVLLRRDGTSFDAEVTIRLLESASDRPVGFMMVVRDRTEQLRLENELRESERRYRNLIEGLNEGVMIVRDGVVTYANPAAERMTGRQRATLEGRPLRQCVATADVLVLDELLHDLPRRGGELDELRCGFVAPDGSARAVRLRASVIDDGGHPAVLLRLVDETDERRLVAELARNETRLDAVLEATSDGILVVADPVRGAPVQMTNRALAELFGVGVEQVLGRSLVDVCALLGGRGAAGERLAELLASGDVGPLAVSLPLEADGTGRALEVSVAPLAGPRGERLGRVVACRDVSEQRRSERQLQQQAERLQLGKVELEQSYRRLNEVNKKLERRGEELDRLNQELRKLNEMKTNLLGNVSHELQTPLVAIRGYTEMILRERLGPISEEQRKGLDLSLKNIDRLIAMIDGLLDLARGERAEAPLSLSRFSLRALVEEALATLADAIAARRIEVAIAFEGDFAIQADRERVLRVLLNLVSNAIKFNREGGAIEIGAAAGQGGFVTVRVRDTGIGIPVRDLGRVFERGFRVERPGAAQPEGSGIGLALVQQILHEHGCTISVRSEVDRGTEFVFTLPEATDGAARVPPAAEGAPDEPPRAASDRADERRSSRPRPAGAPRPRLRIIRRLAEDELR